MSKNAETAREIAVNVYDRWEREHKYLDQIVEEESRVALDRAYPSPSQEVAELVAEARACPFEDACSDEALVKRLCDTLEQLSVENATLKKKLEEALSPVGWGGHLE